MYEKIGRFILARRLPILILILVLTGFFAWQMTTVRVESPTIDLFPSNHPYVETFVKYKDVFGGAGSVLVAVEVKDGTIFNTETLSKVWRITKALEQFPAINNYQVLSLGQRKVKELKRDTEKGFVATPLMWPEVPQDQEELDALMERVYTSPRFFGSLVSYDSKAALIVAGFFEESMEPLDIYQRLDALVESEKDANTEIFMIGRPVMLGYILKQYPQITNLLYYTIAAIVLVLIVYFRDFRGILLPLATATISAIWGLGFLGLLGYNFDPLVIVVPFIISARALSHSVQVVERYMEEFEDRKDRNVAAIRTFKGLFGPGFVAIVTDAAGVFLVYTAPIPLLQKLAVMGGFWVLSIVISDLILNPILLSYLPAPRWSQKTRRGIFHHALVKIGTWAFGWQRWAVIGVTLTALVVAFLYARLLVIGDVHPGTPMLWPDSKYNQDTERIADRFGNTEIFQVIVEGTGRDSIKDAEVLRTIDSFQKHMESIPEVTSTSSIADYLKSIIATLYHNDPKWELIPEQPGFFMEMIYSNTEPGDLLNYVTPDSQNANITLYLRDHKGETLRTVVAHAKNFIAANPMEKAGFRLASGYGGLLAAINEEVAYHQGTVTLLAFAIIIAFCGAAYGSAWAGLLFLLPLVISNYLTYALMGARGIGLDVNALPVVSLGVGLGVDYGLYVVGRIREEYANLLDLRQAVIRGVSTAGKAVAFTAITMIAGVAFWTTSFLRFQAEMGMLLVFWMVISMLGGLILLPTLIAIFKPRFITKVADQK